MLSLVKLSFKRALIAGSTGPSGELSCVIHSDTLFSAIINEWAKLYPPDDIETLVSSLNSDEPSFRISSAFPYFYGDYYLPTPVGVDDIYMEKLKEIQFLELGDFLDLARGNKDRIMKKRLLSALDFMTPFTAPRVAIDRITTSSNPYHISGWSFSEGGGLYFLLELNDESLKDKLQLCISLLGEAGIGADKSMGYGAFTAEFANIDGDSLWTEILAERDNSDRDVFYCSLSLCFPRDDEAKKALSYRILSRRGWIFSSSSTKQTKRRECRMFAEGSLFSSPVSGCVVDVTPSAFSESEHNVYRYGLGIMVGIRGEQALQSPEGSQ